MAMATIRGIAQGTGIYPRQYYSVWIKQNWADDWTFVPWLRPVNSDECAFPSISSAEFVYDYGNYLVAWGGWPYVNTVPLRIQGWYIHILVHTVYGEYIGWIGKVEDESHDIQGVNWDTGVNNGVQTIKAVGIEDCLNRRRVLGTWAAGTEAAVYLKRGRVFNRRSGRGAQLQGNMSVVDGYPLFGTDGDIWNNQAIAQYLLERFSPLEPTFFLTGQIEPLLDIEQEYNFNGRTVLECLHELINRKRGLGAKIITDGVGDVYVYVFSLFAEPIYGAVSFPANQNQIDVVMGQDHHSHATLDIIGLGQYDEIIVEAAEPIKACFTMSSVSGTLEEGWTSTEETAYVAAEESERTSDRFSRVFRYFRVPMDWDWAGVLPCVDENGYPAMDGGAAWQWDKKFLRWLPFEGEAPAGESEQEGQEYIEPFGLAKIPSTDETYGNKYFLIDMLEKIDYPSCSIRGSDIGMGVWVSCSGGQDQLALNSWPSGNTTGNPRLDWSEFLFTVNIDTEETIKIVMPIFPGGIESVNGKQAYIQVPGIECWFVANGTVIDIDNGTLVYNNGGAAEYVRDDTEKLRTIAQMAWGWFGQQRAVLRLDIKNLLNWYQVGDLIMTAHSGLAWEQIGTVVSRITRDYQQGRQTIETGFGELDPIEFSGV